jgi:O-antigen chain-terminating methyltransferase
MSQNFYRAFEDRYRGARDTITERLGVYRPFLRALALLGQPGRPARALDLGCGRGEWLELLAANGLAARGVDLDEGMLQACRERQLDVVNADALSSLRAQPDASLALVSAFHLVEHLPFDMVQDIIAEAQRVLQPGGLLILETPNPENLSVGASSFYLDPSHERPLPPALLSFAVEFNHFARTRVLRLQEAPQLHQDGPIGLLTVLEGVSPDYAVVAQQGAAAEVLAPFDAPFAADYGVTLGQLAGRYEGQLQQQHDAIHQLLQRHAGELHALHLAAGAASDGLQKAAHRAGTLEASLADSDAQLRQQQAELANRLDQLDLRNAQLQQRIVDMHHSSSWRVTAPLRWAGGLAHRLRAALRERRLQQVLRRRVVRALQALMRAALRRPRLKRVARALLSRAPSLQARLYRMAHQPPPVSAAAPPEQQLSPRALLAYQQLQRALGARKS